METWDAIRARRNVRSYTSQPIEAADLDRILEAGWRSPSASNRQKWNFVVVTDREQLQALSTVWQGAGHIAGSAQLLVEYKKERLLYSGDFKLRPDVASESLVVEEADQLIMETTFGKAQYLFPPASKTIEKIADFCQKAIRDNKIPCLLGYSLGKAQELLCSLRPYGLEFVLHPSIAEKVWLPSADAERGGRSESEQGHRLGCTACGAGSSEP